MSLQLFLKNAQYDSQDVLALVQLESESFQTEISASHEDYLIRQMREPGNCKSVDTSQTKPLRRLHQQYESVNQELHEYQGMCWNCGLRGDDLFWPLVKQSSEGIKLKALTCSFPCLLSYIALEYRHDRQRREKAISMARQVFLARNGIQPRCMDTSPSKYEMCCYGGSLSEQAYKDLVNVASRKAQGE